MVTTPTEAYIVTDGEYSDYGILAVFFDRAMAEEFVAQNHGSIEVWPTGALPLPIGYRCYRVTMDEAGNVGSVYTVAVRDKSEDYNDYEDGIKPDGHRDYSNPKHTGHRTFFVTTDMGEQGAIKVTNERRVQLIALNQWPTKGSPMVF